MTDLARIAPPVFDHLADLSDARGLFEHALLAAPRPEHGYCVDDVARAVVVVSREPVRDDRLRRLARVYLQFVVDAVEPDGSCRNRMTVDGRWADDAATDDWWGRALWALGTAAYAGDTAGMRARALTCFRIAGRRRSPHLRATAFAALGAAVLVRRWPDEPSAMELLRDAVTMLQRGPADGWTWPEPRLTYANAALPEALLLAGEVLSDPAATARGLELLGFLLDLQHRAGHLSVTSCHGRGPGEADGPAWDQQPIEVAALADACVSAFRVTGDTRWLEGIRLAWSWFRGGNDSNVVMYDPLTGAGFDGLEPAGRNANQGAESTLAMLSTAQHARAFREML